MQVYAYFISYPNYAPLKKQEIKKFSQNFNNTTYLSMTYKNKQPRLFSKKVNSSFFEYSKTKKDAYKASFPNS